MGSQRYVGYTFHKDLDRSVQDLFQITYQIRHKIIEQVTEERDLGIINDNQMKFLQHLSFATSS